MIFKLDSLASTILISNAITTGFSGLDTLSKFRRNEDTNEIFINVLNNENTISNEKILISFVKQIARDNNISMHITY